MSSRKKRPVLYEVLRRTNGTSAPWRRDSTPTLIETREPDDPIRVDRPRPTPAGPGLSTAIRRWTQAAGERLHFSLTIPLLAGIAIGLIVLVWLAFVTGRRVGERNAPQTVAQNNSAADSSVGGVLGLADELGKGRPQQSTPPAAPAGKKESPKAPDKPADKPKEGPKPTAEKPLAVEKAKGQDKQIVANPGADSVPDANSKKDARDAKSGRDSKDPKDTKEATDASKVSTEVEKAAELFPIEKGKHYVQIQCFPKNLEKDADNAARFLKEHGIPVAKLTRTRDFVLYVRDVFNIRGVDAATAKAERARGEDYIKRIKALGRQYAKEGGDYSFHLADLEER